jgi:hypothetical protein
MSPSGLVSKRCVNPPPAPLVKVCTVLAPIKRSEAFLVVTESVLVVTLFPVELTTTSTGLSRSIPLYSRILMSG